MNNYYNILNSFDQNILLFIEQIIGLNFGPFDLKTFRSQGYSLSFFTFKLQSKLILVVSTLFT